MMVNTKDRKGYRRIVVQGKLWLWKCGRGLSVVAYCRETGEKRLTDASKLTGWSWHNIERSRWKCGGWHVRPQHIADWIAGKPFPTTPA